LPECTTSVFCCRYRARLFPATIGLFQGGPAWTCTCPLVLEQIFTRAAFAFHQPAWEDGSGEETIAKKVITFSGDDWKKVVRFFQEKIGRHPSVASPGDTSPNDATDALRTIKLLSFFPSSINKH